MVNFTINPYPDRAGMIVLKKHNYFLVKEAQNLVLDGAMTGRSVKLNG